MRRKLVRKSVAGVVAVSLLGSLAVITALIGREGVALALIAVLISLVLILLALTYSYLRAHDRTQLARFKHLQTTLIKEVKEGNSIAKTEFVSNHEFQSKLMLDLAQELNGLVKTQSKAPQVTGIDRDDFMARLKSLSSSIESSAAGAQSGLDGATTQLRAYVQDEVRQVLKNQSAQNQRMAAWYENLRLAGERTEFMLAEALNRNHQPEPASPGNEEFSARKLIATVRFSIRKLIATRQGKGNV